MMHTSLHSPTLYINKYVKKWMILTEKQQKINEYVQITWHSQHCNFILSLKHLSITRSPVYLNSPDLHPITASPSSSFLSLSFECIGLYFFSLSLHLVSGGVRWFRMMEPCRTSISQSGHVNIKNIFFHWGNGEKNNKDTADIFPVRAHFSDPNQFS